ncbi:glycosyltransferase [candidate division KSB1 bacterium]|nr:glycosyltransferase [candidate division KSB1 bacterium]
MLVQLSENLCHKPVDAKKREMRSNPRKNDQRSPLLLSIIIVSYNVREFLEQAILSIEKAVGNIKHEIFVVDNNSADGSAELVAHRFPGVHLLRNHENVGFARANNQALSKCRGSYICLINPDTIVQEDTFAQLLAFFENHPKAGAVGCKILNPDGTLQLACRRSFPTPWVAFTKIVGLAKLFPKSRWFGRYNLTYLDADEIAEVEAISGSFMLLRRRVVAQVGPLDESFFMYGEDLDWCYRIRQAGWKIFYVPNTQIVHFKGESSKRSPFEQRRLFYEAMHRFVHKHFRRGQAWVPSWALIVAIYVRAFLSHLSALIRALTWPLMDLFCMTLALAIAIYIRFAPLYPWRAFVIVHVIYTTIWFGSLLAHGVYHRWRFSAVKAASAVLLGWVMNSAVTFFFKEIGFSRLVVLYAGGLNLIFLAGWRFMLKALAQISWYFFRSNLGRLVLNRNALLIGDRESCEHILHRLKRRLDAAYSVRGVVLAKAGSGAEKIGSVPIYTGIDHINELIKREKIQEVIFATDRIPYNQMLGVIAASSGSRVNFKLVPSSMDVMIGKASVEYIDDIPFMEIDYRLHYPSYRIVKRSADMMLCLLLSPVVFPLLLWLRYIRRHPVQRRVFRGLQGENFSIAVFSPPQHRRHWYHHLDKFWPIFTGRMSFVGRELRDNSDLSALSLSIKPGLTGLEYLHEGNAVTSAERERYHLYYMKNYSVFLDAEILIKSWIKYFSKKEKN